MAFPRYSLHAQPMMVLLSRTEPASVQPSTAETYLPAVHKIIVAKCQACLQCPVHDVRSNSPIPATCKHAERYKPGACSLHAFCISCYVHHYTVHEFLAGLAKRMLASKASATLSTRLDHVGIRMTHLLEHAFDGQQYEPVGVPREEDSPPTNDQTDECCTQDVQGGIEL